MKMKTSKMLARGQPPPGEWHFCATVHGHEQIPSRAVVVIKGFCSKGCPTTTMLMVRGASNGEERGDSGEVVTGGEGSSQAPLHRRAAAEGTAPS